MNVFYGDCRVQKSPPQPRVQQVAVPNFMRML
jgi:hypothetical protein